MISKQADATRKPVMVFAGEFWSGASGAGLADGFRALGWAVQEVDYRHYGTRSGRSLVTRLASRVTKRYADENYRRQLLRECESLRPEVFLTIKGSAIDRATLAAIKQAGALTAMYYPDVHFNHPGVFAESFDLYDLFATSKSFQMEWLGKRLGVERTAFVPHGYVERVHNPVYASLSSGDYSADVLYAGNHSAYKQNWLEGLVEQAPDLDLSIIGSRWQENVEAGPLSNCAIHGAMQSVAYAKAIQTAKVNIAIHMGKTSSGWSDVVSTRTFEIPACKGFMLHIDNDEVRELFRPGVEIDVFSTKEELDDKVRFYLGRPDLREKMIERAYIRAVPHYSYAERASTISRIISQKLRDR